MSTSYSDMTAEELQEKYGTGVRITCGCGYVGLIIGEIKDKRGWMCERCSTVFEIDAKGTVKRHLFHDVPGAWHDIPRSVCTGFGGGYKYFRHDEQN